MTNEIKVKPMKARNKRREKQQNKKNQAIVNETLKTAQLEHTKESLISMEKPSVSDDEIVTVEEMSCFYVDPITGEIQTISFEQDKLLHEKKLRDRYIKDYGISEKSFNLTQQFFEEYKHDYQICVKFLKTVILETISRRSDIEATEEDIVRILNTVDTDIDGKINLREFFQLLILFLSNKSTLEQRITGALMEQSYTHEREGFLTDDERAEFNRFLVKFYGRDEEKKQKLSKAPRFRRPYFVGESTYTYYAKLAYENFNQFCFVR